MSMSLTSLTQILDQYHFGRMKLHDVAVTPDSLRLIGVGPLLESPSGLQPSKSRAEKRVVGACGVKLPIAYCLMHHEQSTTWKRSRSKSTWSHSHIHCHPFNPLSRSSQTPVLNDVRDITLAQDMRQGVIALVSYENKVCSVLSFSLLSSLVLIQTI